MIQKTLSMKSKHKFYTVVAVITVFIIIFYASPVLAAGLVPPSATTEPYTGQDINQNPIVKWIIFFINWLSVIIIAGSIVVIAAAGIQYTTAGGDSNKVAEAKKRITNVLVALLSYFFLYSFINWLVPGVVL